MLIAIIYIVTGATNLINYFSDKTMAAALLSLLLGLGTAWLALLLSSARGWSIFTRFVRVSIADYAATFSILVFIAIPYAAFYEYTPASNPGGNQSDDTISTLEVSVWS